MMAKRSRRDRIIAAGKLLYGERWQSPMARLVGLSPALLQKIADGSREVTDDVYVKVARALVDESDRVLKSADKVTEIAVSMLAELDSVK